MEKICVRNAKINDIDSVIKLENIIWPEGTRAPREKFEKRLEIFSKGFFVAFKDKKMIGVSTSEIINYDPENPPISWEEITDGGWIKKTHKPNGNALYVVSVGAISRSGGGSALVQAQKDLTKKLNLKYLVLGARIPGYGNYCEENKEIAIDDYTKLKKGNELLDPELRFYTRNGLNLVKIMQNYMEDDKESRNYGAIMVWENLNM